MSSLDGGPFRPIAHSEDASIVVVSAGRQRTLRLRTDPRSLQRFFLDDAQASKRIFSVGSKRVGYFHLWSGTHEAFLAGLEAELTEFEHAQVDAIIIDLRGGFGGANLDYLSKLRQLDIRTFVLIDDGTRSGKEWVSATIKRDRLATLVGSRTAGSFLGGSPFELSEERYLLFLAVNTFTPPDIGPIEGIGVEPDVAVAPCRVDCRGVDPQFDRVIELIRGGNSSE